MNGDTAGKRAAPLLRTPGKATPSWMGASVKMTGTSPAGAEGWEEVGRPFCRCGDERALIVMEWVSQRSAVPHRGIRHLWGGCGVVICSVKRPPQRCSVASLPWAGDTCLELGQSQLQGPQVLSTSHTRGCSTFLAQVLQMGTARAVPSCVGQRLLNEDAASQHKLF